MSNTFQCPNCKHRYSLVEASPVRADGASGWDVPYQQRRMRQLNLGNGPSQAVTEAVRETPVSSAASSLESNFKTPLAIALTSGAFTVAGSLFIFRFDLMSGALPLATVVTIGTWFWQVKDDRFLKRTFERIIGQDIDGDGYVGEPPEPKKKMRITVTEKQKGSRSWTGYFDSPIEEPVLGQFARAFLAGRPMGERNWTGAGQPFSVNEYVGFRDELMGRGLVRWKNDGAHRQGFKLTLRGERVFKELAAIPATTPPELLQ